MRTFKNTLIPIPPFSICWNLIPKNKKMALEIGAGNGEFSLQFSKQNPDWFLISLERTSAKSLAFQQKSQAYPHWRKNLYFVRADGVNVITHLVPSGQFDKIFILYPNPYVKEKQRNLRWHNMPFFTELLRKIKPNGDIELRTNLKWYAEEFQNQMKSHSCLQKSLEQRLSLEKDLPQTAFERKYLKRGESCHQLIYKKLTDN